MTTTQDLYATTYHTDGTVTVWDVYSQQWLRRIGRPNDRILASLSPEERERVIRHCGAEICGSRIQIDRSGVGQGWVNATDDDLPPNVRDEIAAEIIDGERETCRDYLASNGTHYRW